MEQNNSQNIAATFAASSLSQLVDNFNSHVGIRAWTAARAEYDRALIAELVARNIDLSAVYDGTSISFAHHVQLNDTATALVLTD